MAGKFQPVADRFWSKVDYGPRDRCWLWRGGICGKGYGNFGLNRNGEKMVMAHRMSWRLVYGDIPAGLFICHKCDNPRCVNPFHLFPGTRTENVQDMIRKKRDKNSKKTHCKYGHEFKPENTLKGSKGQRQCRICKLDYLKHYKRWLRAAYRARGEKPPY